VSMHAQICLIQIPRELYRGGHRWLQHHAFPVREGLDCCVGSHVGEPNAHDRSCHSISNCAKPQPFAVGTSEARPHTSRTGPHRVPLFSPYTTPECAACDSFLNHT